MEARSGWRLEFFDHLGTCPALLLVVHGQDLVRLRLKFLSVNADGPLQFGFITVELRLNVIHHRNLAASTDLIHFAEVCPI